jgi:hypothetical protein
MRKICHFVSIANLKNIAFWGKIACALLHICKIACAWMLVIAGDKMKFECALMIAVAHD